eukprot:m.179588 g.179588  ORF g.179588 m.179588 type:complete len:192 (+) comp39223_c1_seq2:441-1016(+)
MEQEDVRSGKEARDFLLRGLSDPGWINEQLATGKLQEEREFLVHYFLQLLKKVDGDPKAVTKVIETLLENGADVNSAGREKKTALHWAVATSNLRQEAFRRILRATKDVNARDATLMTPMHTLLVSSKADVGLFYQLLQSGGDMTIAAPSVGTPFHCLLRRKEDVTDLLKLVREDGKPSGRPRPLARVLSC